MIIIKPSYGRAACPFFIFLFGTVGRSVVTFAHWAAWINSLAIGKQYP